MAKALVRARLLTGVAGLDDILRGGLPSGHVYLIEGDPGSGKTTLGIQFLLAGLANNEPALYVTLAESSEELQAVADSHGFDISKIEIFEVQPPELDQKGADQYTVFHPSEVELVDVMQSILSKLEKTKARRIVFDSMSEIRMLARDPLRYRRQILSLKQFFVGRECTVLLLDDPPVTVPTHNCRAFVMGQFAWRPSRGSLGRSVARFRYSSCAPHNFAEEHTTMRSSKGDCRFFPASYLPSTGQRTSTVLSFPAASPNSTCSSAAAFLEDLHLYLWGRRVAASPQLRPSSCSRRQTAENAASCSLATRL